MTAEQMAALAGQGPYWWMRPNGEFYATEEYDESSDDLFLLHATPRWVAQWPDWDAAVAELTPLFAVLDEFRQNGQ